MWWQNSHSSRRHLKLRLRSMMSRRPGPTSRTPRVGYDRWCCSRRGLDRRGSVTTTATATTSRSTRGSGRRLLVNHLRLLRIEARLHAWYQWNTSHWNASHWYTGHRHTSHWHTRHGARRHHHTLGPISRTRRNHDRLLLRLTRLLDNDGSGRLLRRWRLSLRL